MKPQAEITIKVPLEVAEAYHKTSEEERQKIETKIAFFLKTSTLDRQKSIKKLQKTMDEIGQKAIERGFTPEILESILNEDE